MSETVLYSYFRSSCAYRVRIALNIKKIPYEMKFVNIYTGEQKDPTYMAVNPSAMVPSLMIDGHMLRQSTAIIEYLEDTRPSAPKLLPNDPHKRAAVREIAEIVACDIQPIQNLRVSAMVADFCQKYQPTITDDERMKIRNDWSREVITDRFRGIEKLLASTSGDYCVGNGITLADVFLAPQVYNANRFSVPMSEFPLISGITERLNRHEAFVKAHPHSQPDCPPELKSSHN